MTLLPRWIVAGLIFATGLLVIPVPALAKASKWSDGKGGTFRGEPVQVLGPFALFQDSGHGRRVRLRSLSEEECRRLYAEVAARPPRNASFASAQSAATGDLVGRVRRVEREALVPADLSGMPEPELLLVLAGSHTEGEGWIMAGNLGAAEQRVKRV